MKRRPFAKFRNKRQESSGGELSLAAMVDMMMNILIFLLFLYGSGGLEVQPSEDMQLAKSEATDAIRASVTLVVSYRTIVLGGETVLDLVDDHGIPRLPEGIVTEGRLPDLSERLTRALAKAADKPLPEGKEFVPELLVETDRRVPWSVLAPVLRSATDAGFEQYRFIVAVASNEQ